MGQQALFFFCKEFINHSQKLFFVTMAAFTSQKRLDKDFLPILEDY